MICSLNVYANYSHNNRYMHNFLTKQLLDRKVHQLVNVKSLPNDGKTITFSLPNNGRRSSSYFATILISRQLFEFCSHTNFCQSASSWWQIWQKMDGIDEFCDHLSTKKFCFEIVRQRFGNCWWTNSEQMLLSNKWRLLRGEDGG